MVSPVFVELRAATGQFQLKMAEAEASIKRLNKTGADNFAKLRAAGRGAFLGVAAAGTVVGVASVKMAADFQQATNQLITSAGESRANIDLVRKGLLDLSVQAGSSATELAKGMYYIESAGFHGAAGLEVLRAATQGAKAEGASFETVANAVTSAMNSYNLPASKAVAVTDSLVATVAAGKIRMEDLSAAIAGVLPVAASAHLSLAQIGGAMATMSSQGTPAAVAATYLRQTIGQLENPSKKARNEMKALGLSALDISANLGARGLTGTLDILVNAIQSKMGPSGVVLLNTLRNAGDNSAKFQAALNNLPPAAQTYVGALSTMVGGVKTMQAALQLSGPHLATFKANVDKVSAGARNAGKDVKGWDIVQQNFNYKVGVLKASLEKLAIEIGTKLIPVVEKVVSWMTRHKNIVTALAAVIAGALAIAMAAYLGSLVLAAARTALLAARTVVLNFSVATAILRNRANTIALNAEGAAALRAGAAMRTAALGVGLLTAALLVNENQGNKYAHAWANVKDHGSPNDLPKPKQSSLSDQQKARLQADLNSDDPKVAARARAKLAAAAAKDSAANSVPTADIGGGMPVVDVSAYDHFDDGTTKTKTKTKSHAAADRAAAARARALAIAKAKAAQAAAVAAAKAAAQKIIDGLRAEIAARNEVIRLMTVQMRLAGQAGRDLSLVNGAVLNRGASFGQIAAGGSNVTVHVHGAVLTDRALTQVVQDGLNKASRTGGGVRTVQ